MKRFYSFQPSKYQRDQEISKYTSSEDIDLDGWGEDEDGGGCGRGSRRLVSIKVTSIVL